MKAFAVRKELSVAELAAVDRFGRFKKLDMSETRQAALKPDERLKGLRGLWKEHLDALERSRKEDNDGMEAPDYIDLAYSIAKMTVKAGGLRYAGKDAAALAILMALDESIPPGPTANPAIFLSALINVGADNEYGIPLLSEWDNFAYRNTKDLVLDGNVRNCFGKAMASGTVILKGNAGTHACGLMRGGSVEIKGNAGDRLGHYLAGDARIIVEGNASYLVGHFMEGGEIHVHGEIGSIGDVKSGRIFHKGKLIVDK